ncbi:MAG: hypothetical protein J6F30_13145 [Cellulosilyticum sp.]|nr:hypothetical protein [Cellulosilyticum sp.]
MLEKRNKEVLMKMFALKCEGKTFQAIADELGVSKQAVQQSLSSVIAPRNRKGISVFDTINIFTSENNLTRIGFSKEIDFTGAVSSLNQKLKGLRKFTIGELVNIRRVVGEDAFEEIISYYTNKPEQ